MKKFFLSLIILFFFPLSCARSVINKSDSLRFVITGNTAPASAFAGIPENLQRVIEQINADNPVFVIHTGNMVRGGMGWMGINDNDVSRQYLEFLKSASMFNSLLYTLAGTRDGLNRSFDLYKKYMKRDLNYSFNYGNNHFIILNTANIREIKQNEFEWLEKDLDNYRKCAAIFIITHRPVIAFPGMRIRYKDGEKLHKLFLKYPVKAVFSGSYSRFVDAAKDGIRYIIAGCGSFTEEDKYRFLYHYYVMNINETLSVEPRRLNKKFPL